MSSINLEAIAEVWFKQFKAQHIAEMEHDNKFYEQTILPKTPLNPSLHTGIDPCADPCPDDCSGA